MTTTPQAPRRLLFATDLSSRCDRALDRAVLLGRQWQASAVALTVLDAAAAGPDLRGVGGPGRTPQHVAEQRLRADLAVEDLPFTVRVAQGPVADAVLAVAQAERADLIVTGVARNEALSRALLGSTVDALARRASVPLLVVRSRARAPYPRVRVATDLSEAARHTLRCALALFPEAELTAFHAFDQARPVLPGMDAAQARAAAHADALRAAEDWLRGAALSPEQQRRVRLEVEQGDAAVLLHAHSAHRPEDLIVLGRRSRGPLAAFLLGSVSARALQMAEGDVLVVPPPG